MNHSRLVLAGLLGGALLGGGCSGSGSASGMDAGPSKIDAGPSKTDAGPSKTDAGPSKTDAGPSKTDAGPSKTDAGPSKDAGTPLTPDWYVDNTATGANNGTSWTNAWQSFADIGWSVVKPGDTIVVSGGSTGQTYPETLDVGASGTNGSPITIAASDEAGHDGVVTIDGQDTRSNCIHIRPRSWVTVSNMHLENASGAAVYISGSSGSTYSTSGASSHVTIAGMTILANHGRGVFIQTSDNVVVRGCDITTPTYVAAQTDGIYSQRDHDCVFEHNHIVINNQETTGHDDCIQLFQDTSTIIRDNNVAQVNDKVGNAQGIYATTMYGDTKYYDNVVNLNNAQSNAMTFQRLTGTGTVEMYGNTVYSIRAFHGAWITGTPDPIVKDNIFFRTNAGTAFDLAGWAGDPSHIDYNLDYSPASSNVVTLNGSSLTWSQWRSRGFDTHGVNADPRVVDLSGGDFHLQATSPAIDAGLDLGPPYDLDLEGVKRPVGAGWDMGAYEYTP